MNARYQVIAGTVGVVSLFLFVACPPTAPDEIKIRPYDWEVSTPGEQNLDSLTLSEAGEEAGEIADMGSLLIVRNGYLVWEQYYNGYDQYDVWHARSVTKSVISALVGIALQEGYLDSVGQRLADLLPEYYLTVSDSAKWDITLEHLLTMTAGFVWEDSDEQFLDEWYFSLDWLDFAIDQPLSTLPGTSFHYNSSLSHLVSGILTVQSGMTTRLLAKRYLFDPLGISLTRWDRGPEGIYMGGFGLFLPPRDMARFGQLYVDGGFIDGQQILSEEWIEESTRKHVSLTGGSATGYGYFWWQKPFGIANFVASGAGGQMIYNFPTLRLVVVTTAASPGNSIIESLDTIVEYYILPAVRD